ncbi:hypothetical protein CHS0354_004433 [Potamilus streckersoni]|uniref:Uncharacterized protein n=1 Tax=Potamilus streckersoni TaxID=2493646 RepID=A0AAE0WAK1_9BIVA|nr:hypothetical protein CHS0354_004433 [Potamilus streckersoni]
MVITVPMNFLPKPLLSGFTFLEAFNEFVQNLPNEYGGYLILDNFPSKTQAINQIGTYRLLLIKFGPWDSETEDVMKSLSQKTHSVSRLIFQDTNIFVFCILHEACKCDIPMNIMILLYQ